MSRFHAVAAPPRLRPASTPFPRRGAAITGLAWSRRAALLAVFGVLIWIGMLQLGTPDAVPADAPATAFSAGRAMEHLRAIASESRAIGMPGHEAARAYLVDRLTAMGLEVEEQTTASAGRFEGAETFNAGMVTNVLARIPGTDSTGAIALNAHYDSGATGPGASDNGAGVAAVLETVRALRAGPGLRNDLIVVFSDGEEHGDLGAGAFTREHRWAADVRLALNYEAQGSGGPVLLYATSADNGWLAREFLEVAPDPAAYSLFPEIVHLLAGQRLACDLEDYLERGSAGLGFVYAADTPAYHTVRDSVATIDPGSIQQQGGYTLAVARHFGTLNLANLPRAENRIFFTVLPGVTLHYAGALVVPLAGLATALLGGLLWVGARRRVLSAGRTAAGAAALAGGSVATVLMVGLLWAGVRALTADPQVWSIGSSAGSLYAAALSVAALAAMMAIFALVWRRVGTANLFAGALLAWAGLLWLASLALPGASYLLLWPLLFGLLPLVWQIFGGAGEGRQWLKIALLGVAALPVVILLPGTAYQMVALLNRVDYMANAAGGVPVLGVWALFIAPLAGLLIPHVEALSGERRWLAPGVLACLAAGLLVWASLANDFDAGHPRPNSIAYDLDAGTGAARWVSIDPRLDAWTSQFFPGDPAKGDYEVDVGVTLAAYEAPAPVVVLEAPAVDVVSDTLAGDRRDLRLRLTSPRGGALLRVAIETGGEIVAASLAGVPLDLDGYGPGKEGRFQFAWAGVPVEGVVVDLSVRQSGAVRIALSDVTYGLPAIPGWEVGPRPAEFMPAPGYPLDPTVVRRTVTI